MKTRVQLIPALALLAVTPAMAQTTYTGTGDADGSAATDGGGISSVVVNNDSANLSFTINSTETMASYIFYAIELQIVGEATSGDIGHVNPWGPLVGISTGENAVINTYGTGATPGTYNGSWNMGSGISYVAGGTGFNYATISVPLSDLGLSPGQSFYFDVVSSYTSGSQAAYGALDNMGYPPESDDEYMPWSGTSYYDSAISSGTTFGTPATLYTVTSAPEPTTFALMGLGTLALIQRLRREQR